MTTHAAAAASVPHTAPRRVSGPGRIKTQFRLHHSVIVNHTLASLLWPEGNAVGRRIRQGTNGPWETVVGVVNDIEMRMNVSNNRLVLQMYRPLVTIAATPQMYL